MDQPNALVRKETGLCEGKLGMYGSTWATVGGSEWEVGVEKNVLD